MPENIMIHECYYCGQVFDTKEKLYIHLDVHAKPKSEQSVVVESKLSEDEVLEQFNDTKIGEPSRMGKKALENKKKKFGD